MPKRFRYKCGCSCGCEKTPGCRRVVCRSCKNHVCPGFCLALELVTENDREVELVPENDREQYSLCRQCISRGTVLPDDGVARVLCDGYPYPPDASLQDLIFAYVIFSYLQAYSLIFVCDSDDWASDEDGWDIL